MQGPSFYGEDLTYIHHAGFASHARSAGETVLSRLHDAGIDSGLVVDLGCGSGVWAEMFAAAGFEVLGFNISPAMIRLARRNVPTAEFRCASIREVQIPSCVAVTAFGEVLNYRTADRSVRPVLVAVSEQPADRVVRCDITLFRKIGNRYRRSAERHLLDALDSEQVASLLSGTGFAFDVAEKYGEYRVGEGRRIFFARKIS